MYSEFITSLGMVYADPGTTSIFVWQQKPKQVTKKRGSSCISDRYMRHDSHICNVPHGSHLHWRLYQYTYFAGSTKASIQAVLSPHPVSAAVVTSNTSAAVDPASPAVLPESYCFDAANTGSFPPKPALTKTIDGVHGSQSKSFAPTDSAIQQAVEQTGKSTRDARALDMPFKHNKALPLELFDNPETEVIPPEERISNRPSDQPGALARSRFYNSRGEFAWAPCFVIAYDRYRGLFVAVWCQ